MVLLRKEVEAQRGQMETELNSLKDRVDTIRQDAGLMLAFFAIVVALPWFQRRAKE
jgi:hypothetical protein